MPAWGSQRLTYRASSRVVDPGYGPAPLPETQETASVTLAVQGTGRWLSAMVRVRVCRPAAGHR